MDKELSGSLDGTGLKIAIVASRFNDFMVTHLISGAKGALTQHGVSEEGILVYRVPGAFEIPTLCSVLIEEGSFDGIVALGVLIKGATDHYDLICNEVTRGIGALSRDNRFPIGFGVVTANSQEEAIERCGSKAGNKGVDAALATLEMVNATRLIEKAERAPRSVPKVV